MRCLYCSNGLDVYISVTYNLSSFFGEFFRYESALNHILVCFEAKSKLAFTSRILLL